MLFLLVERRRRSDSVHVAIDLDAGEAALHQFGQFFAVFALTPTDDWRKQQQPAAGLHFKDAVDHLAYSLALDRQPGCRRIGHTDAGIEQAEIIVNLGHRAYRGARIFRCRLLLDGDRRRQAVDRFDIGFLHQLQELPGISREALDIAALPFGIDGIEGE